MDIGVLKEAAPQEKRVAVTPNIISKINDRKRTPF